MEKIESLCKRRGFVFPGSEIYGGLSNSWDYGSYGVQLKKNIKDHWWKFFVERRDDMVGLDAAIIMNPKTWESSGHLANFSDPLIECKECNHRSRADQIPGIDVKMKEGGLGLSYSISLEAKCPNCGKSNFSEPSIFNLMMETGIGPVHLGGLYFNAGMFENSGEKDKKREVILKINKAAVYLRPETAQAIFVDFPNIISSTRKKLPFGVAQIGKSFRNEITPGNFIFRTREFEQMEIEYFFNPKKDDWNKLFDELKLSMEEWMVSVGISKEKVHAVEIPDGERAHYSKRTIDFEFEYPFGQKELFGLAYRGNYDLSQHQEFSGKDMSYFDSETNEKVIPHVIEPSLGVDRGLLAILLSSYQEEELGEGDVRIVLKLKPTIAPVQVAVFPLLKNKPELVAKAREIYDALKMEWRAEFDDNGNVGKRYRRQDEIGTPYCITVDFDSLEDGAVTVRDRDTMAQERVKIADLKAYLLDNLNK